ncbi:unnamed protein product [Miscanthus lutarioriparius]|uniref:indole-3-pyruvate monooxygenase n=1 Tax=Miscanthus lutarioriparius TaxID=422564 RepID=A0A811SKH5_9POAL|nr:unnamed protein product [Miscanthus lutarioriparius]
MDRYAETQGKRAHDPLYSPRRAARATATGFPVGEHGEVLAGPVIVGAGPAGLAVAACLTMRGVPYVLLERHGCVASLWRHRTYRRLRLHLPKRYCELPLMHFPPSYPDYPTRDQFLAYLEDYIATFGIRPFFHQAVVSAEHDGDFWCVRTVVGGGSGGVTSEYRSKWLVVATGENAEPVVPDIDGIHAFRGLVMHSSDYRSGEDYRGKKVLVVGCGNSGTEVSLDLSNHNVHTSMVVRDSVHVLPREIMGLSTFGLSMWLLMCLSVQTVDQILLVLTQLVLGDTARLGIPRPSIGPMELKKVSGKTPVLDVGTIAKIKSGDIKFIDGKTESFDVVILATGYKSNVPYWLKEKDFFSEKNGFPHNSNEWKGKNGLYAAGFSRRGLLGVSVDATNIADDIVQCWNDFGYERHKSK